jgi:hypothetical protein
MVEIPEYPENPRVRTMVVDSFVVRDTERSERKGRIILRNVISELESLGITPHEKASERVRGLLERLELDLPMVAAHAKR